MARTKKPTEVIYGIEITKPHSTDMYAHNDMVADEMKANILNKWNALIYGIDPETDWEDFADNESTVELQKLVCYSGYGSGYTLEMNWRICLTMLFTKNTLTVVFQDFYLELVL